MEWLNFRQIILLAVGGGSEGCKVIPEEDDEDLNEGCGGTDTQEGTDFRNIQYGIRVWDGQRVRERKKTCVLSVSIKSLGGW